MNKFKIAVSGLKYRVAIGKAFTAKDGKVERSSMVQKTRQMSAKPIYEVFESASEFFRWRCELGPEDMLLAGNWASPAIKEKLVIPRKHDNTFELSDIAHATRELLAFREGWGVAIIDIDVKSPHETPGYWPVGGLKPLQSPEEVHHALIEVVPELVDAPIMVLDGNSAMIERRTDNGEWVIESGPGSFRVYVVVQDARLIPELLKKIQVKCWAKGLHCWAFVSGGGQVLERSLADQALGRPTQPDYVAPAPGPGLRHARRCKIFNVDAAPFDISKVCLSSQEQTAADARLRQAKEILKPIAVQVLDERKAHHVELLVKKGMPPPEAAVAAERRFESGQLLGVDEIEFGGDLRVPVAELIEFGSNYDGMSCFDPIEPDYDGRRFVAKFYWNGGDRPGISSFAHGLKWYHCRHDNTSIMKAIVAAEGDKARILRSMALAELSGIGGPLAENAAAAALGLGARRKELRDEIRQLKKGNFGDHPTEIPGSFQLSQPLPKGSFPKINTTGNSISLVPHMDNLRYILTSYGFVLYYDVIAKRIIWEHPDIKPAEDHSDVQFFSEIQSLCALNGLHLGKWLVSYCMTIAAERERNPVTEHLSSLVWDGKHRFSDVARAFGGDQQAADIALRIFFIEACAAADAAEIAHAKNSNVRRSFEYVPVLVGPQGAGKTKVFRRLLSKKLRQYFGESTVLNLRDKDSVKKALSYWITEFGELDATFSASSMAQLKGFLSNGIDEIRAPYAVAASRYMRRTMFVATVNEPQCLHDPTGNRRFVPVEVDTIDPSLEKIDIEQVWAEAWHRYTSGEQWWPTQDESDWLQSYTEGFEEETDIFLRLSEAYDWSSPPNLTSGRRTAANICDEFYMPTSSSRRHAGWELRQVGNVLAKLWKGNPHAKRVDGRLCIQLLDGTWVGLRAGSGKKRGWYMPARLHGLLSGVLGAGVDGAAEIRMNTK
jgi:hypothetical protein